MRPRRGTAAIDLLRQRMSVAEGVDDGPPQRGQLSAAAVGGLLAYRCVHEHETFGRIDEDRLASHTEQREHGALTREDPRLVAVTQERRCDTGSEMSPRPAACRLRDPGRRNDLLTAPISVVRQQQA